MEKKLHRNSRKAVLGGVAAGLSDYFAIDPVIVRVLFVVSLFFSFGTSLLVYIVLWAVLPDQHNGAVLSPGTVLPEPEAPVQTTGGDNKNTKVIGIALLVIGGYLLLDELRIFYHFHHYFWPLALIGLGAFLLLRRRDEAAESSDRGPIITPPPASSGPDDASVQYRDQTGDGADEQDDIIKVN